MFVILHALGIFVADLFKSRTRLEAENVFLRHQLDIALRRAPPRLRQRGRDRALLDKVFGTHTGHPYALMRWQNRPSWREMIGLLCLFLVLVTAPCKSKSRLEAENAALRHQLIVLRRKMQGRVRLTNSDRWFFIQLYRWFPSILKVLSIIRPETLVRWHRARFRRYWRWKSHAQGGRPQIDTDLRALIRRMSMENPLWGAPRIHGELLKLGFEVAQSSVTKYMVKRRRPRSQGWRTFLRNHAPNIAAMDLFVVPTIGFDLLYAFVIVRLGRYRGVPLECDAALTSSAIGIGSTAALSHAGCVPWASGTSLLHRPRLGRMAVPNG